MERQVYYIYWIFFKNHIYVGATNNLERRQRQHRYKCFNMLIPAFNMKVYKKLRQLGIKREEINLQVLEITDSITKQECDLIERKWIDLLKADLNTYIPGRTQQEYYQNNQEFFKQKRNEYYENHKEEAKEYQIEYRNNNRGLVNERQREYREKKRESINKNQRLYRKNNKEILSKKARERYQDNREDINRKRREKRKNQNSTQSESSKESYEPTLEHSSS